MTRNIHWSRLAERGSYWCLALTFALYRALGRRFVQALLFPITLWFFVTGVKARRASREYLEKVHQAGALDHAPAWRDAFRHFYAFSESALDKVDAWAGNVPAEQVDFSGRSELEKLARDGRGALFITAHLGNIEVARAIGTTKGWSKINAIVYTDHARKFNALLNRLHPQSALNLIHVASFGVDTAIHLKEKVDAGEWLFIVGDRTPVGPNDRVVKARFLGSPAPFAIGPYVLAHLLGCQVYLIFCVREARRYHIHLEPFAERIALPSASRQQEIERWAALYAGRLEQYTLKSPYQWFNFYDYWEGN